MTHRLRFRDGMPAETKKAPYHGAFSIRASGEAYARFGSLNASISPLNASTGMHAHITFLSP